MKGLNKFMIEEANHMTKKKKKKEQIFQGARFHTEVILTGFTYHAKT